MKTYALRLTPEDDLKAELKKFVKDKNLQAGFILSCVGSLKHAKLRMADESIKEFSEKYEIVSLTGTLCQDGCHLHLSISDNNSNTFGGHMKDNCIVHTTAEIVIGESNEFTFSREFDKETEFKELIVTTAK